MELNRYCVEIDGDIVADHMNLEYALILVKGLFETFYNDHGMTVTIKECRKEEH